MLGICRMHSWHLAADKGAQQIHMCTLHLSLAWLLQGGNAWTQEEKEALKTSIAAAGSDEDRDWDQIAAYPGLENRTGVRMLSHAAAQL